jgi:hypothetical protein
MEMSLTIMNRRTMASVQKRYEGSLIFDVTSRGTEPWIRFSPFYPHKNIPVPFSPGYVSTSVEGIWQGLKVFEKSDVDTSKFTIITMHGLKRFASKYGKVLGHRKGVYGMELLTYVEARKLIYLPSYLWMLEHCVYDMLGKLKQLSREEQVILLDYETNCDIENDTRPLSHAGLIKSYLDEM